MKIKRDEYLKELIDSQWDGQIKVITGLRRSGKSYLLKTLFRDYLRRERGVDGGHILVLELDLAKFAAYRNPIRLAERVEEWAKGGGKRYLFIDEIQMCEEVPNPDVPNGKGITFYDALNEFRIRRERRPQHRAHRLPA